jgi:hypothetical protein
MTILETAKPAESASRENYRIKALIVGPSGSGKTTSVALTLPKPVLVIDYDNRAASVAGFDGIKVITEAVVEPNPKSPQAWAKAEQLKDELWTAVRKGSLEYASVVEAGLSSMNRIAMFWALLLDPKRGLGGSPAKQHYGPQIKNLQDHILSMINLPVNYVLEAHYDITKDEESGMTIFLPKIYGEKFRTELPGMFNECYHAYHLTDKESKKERYFWHTKGFDRFDFMKSSLNQLGKYWSDPIEIDLSEPVSGFQKLLELRFGKEEKK